VVDNAAVKLNVCFSHVKLNKRRDWDLVDTLTLPGAKPCCASSCTTVTPAA
jgi:hypothetical protein